MGMAVSADTAPFARRRPHTARGLAAARAEFAEAGYAGVRMDEIAARTRTSKRMSYFYFGSDEGVLIAVLEGAYREIRQQEQLLDADEQDPVDAVRRLAELTFDHHEARADFVRPVSIENVHRGRHLPPSRHLTDLRTPALAVIERFLRRGRESRRITAGVDALGLLAFINLLRALRWPTAYLRAAARSPCAAAGDVPLGDRSVLGAVVVFHAGGELSAPQHQPFHPQW